MVLVIFADAVKSMDDRNAMTFQLIPRTDAREHENLRRVIHARAEDDFVRSHRMFVSVLSVTNAFGFLATKDQGTDRRLADDREISSRSRRTEIGHRRRLSFAVFDIARRRRDAVGIQLVLIVEARQSQ